MIPEIEGNTTVNQEGFLTGNGYWLTGPFVANAESAWGWFGVRLTLTKLGISQTIFQHGENGPGSAGHLQFELTAANKFRYTGRNHVGFSIDETVDIGELQIGASYLLLKLGHFLFWNGKLIQNRAGAPSFGGSRGPTFFGRDWQGNTASILFHELFYLNPLMAPLYGTQNVGDVTTAAQIAALNYSPAQYVMRRRQFMARYEFTAAGFDTNLCFPDLHTGMAPPITIGGGLEQRSLETMKYRFGYTSNGVALSNGYPIPVKATQLMRDRWYPGVVNTILNNMALTGPLTNFDGSDIVYSPLYRFPLILSINNGQSAALDLSFNKMGGTANAADVAVSNVKISGYNTVRLNNQTPVGQHDLTWEQDVNMVEFNASSGRYSKLKMLAQQGKSVVVGILRANNNLLNQTLAHLFDNVSVRVQRLFVNDNPNLNGPVVLSDNAISFTAYACNLSGTIPPLPATFTGEFHLDSNPLIDGLPPHFADAAQVRLNGSKVSGTLIANKATEITIGGLQPNPAAASDVLIVDASNATVGGNIVSINHLKEVVVYLPTGTAASKQLNFYYGRNTRLARSPAQPDGFPPNFRSPGGIDLEGCNNAVMKEQIIPLGTNIGGSGFGIARLSYMESPETTINATIDCLLDNNATAAFWGANQKALLVQGSGPITNGPAAGNYNLANQGAYMAGRPNRLSALATAVKTLNFHILSSQASITKWIFWQRINSFVEVPGHADKVAFTISNPQGYGVNNALNSYTLDISDATTNTAYNATGLTVLARGNSVADAVRNLPGGDQLGNKTGAFFIIGIPFNGTEQATSKFITT